MALPTVRAWVTDGGPSFSLAEGAVLRRLAEEGPVRMSRVAGWQGLDRSTVTTQVAALEQRGLVLRSRDPRDGRAVLVRVTPDAVRALARAQERVQQLVASFLTGWPVEDRERLGVLLDRLVQRMLESGPPTARNDEGSAPEEADPSLRARRDSNPQPSDP